MIVSQDKYLPKDLFEKLHSYCKENTFEIKKAGDKEFSILPTPEYIIPHIQIEGHKLILTFIRNAYKGFDDNLRIHADGIINNERTDLASVLYINKTNETIKNGTAFYEHHKYGYKLPDNISEKEFNRLITEDSNDASKWEPSDFVQARPNRMLTYNSSYFHSKFPHKIISGERIVLVSFYSKI